MNPRVSINISGYLREEFNSLVYQLRNTVQQADRWIEMIDHQIDGAMKNGSLSIKEVDFSKRTIRVLTRLKVKELGQIADLSPDNLLAVRGCGRKTMNEIKDVIEIYGLTLKTP